MDGSMKGRSRGKTPVVGSRFSEHMGQPAPYGIRDNHIIRDRPGESAVWPTSSAALVVPLNVVYDTYTDYLNDSDREPWGSDIDPNNFWETHLDDSSEFVDENVEAGIWYGYDIDTFGYAYTGDWLGRVFVPNHPWIWHSGWSSYLYKARDSNWFYLPGNTNR